MSAVITRHGFFRPTIAIEVEETIASTINLIVDVVDVYSLRTPLFSVAVLIAAITVQIGLASICWQRFHAEAATLIIVLTTSLI